ncbi:AAA family ATPase [Candidatus Palauibacter sp.]|uniref:AAA family ATPase n=1 Tax=Candidatus Palauibacter sp. TaxID=3101350 RepID=UPI003B01B32E
MRIQRLHLTDYKRFTDLTVGDIPSSARLVVLVGPNGSGKSSLFDAFLLKVRNARSNYVMDTPNAEYYLKDRSVHKSVAPSDTRSLANRVQITFHSTQPPSHQLGTIFNIRSPYRHEADFQLTQLGKLAPSSDSVRFPRIIDADAAVSENYARLAWKRMADLDNKAPGNMTFAKYRRESLLELQQAMSILFHDPPLTLQDFGGITEAGVFRFTKGAAVNFHYKNLSGGEKAAFDLLLDLFVKREEFTDAIFCVDEPEAHIATPLHGALLEAMCQMIPEESQLWIATHSIGFIRRAYKMSDESDTVTFLDFSGHDFDKTVTIKPRIPSKSFWRRTYDVTLDDLADLIAPRHIVLCEGNPSRPIDGFDATCYNGIFSGTHPDTLFVSSGSATEVVNKEHMIATLGAIARGVTVWRLVDRDEMTDTAREQQLTDDVRVLRRREIENYLYDESVLRTFLQLNDKLEYVESILERRGELLNGQSSITGDMKLITQRLFQYIKSQTKLDNLGNNRTEFAIQFLVPALRDTQSVFDELAEDIFP